MPARRKQARGSLVEMIPVLQVRDVDATARHFRDKLGFKVDWKYGRPASYATLMFEGKRLHLSRRRGRGVAMQAVAVYFWLRSVDPLAKRFRASGAKIDFGPEDFDWGMREFGVRTPDGHLLVFGAERKHR
jgi:catechol 2,3-dioxygenase-like lactoylglutathione lyase family enzyme